MSRNGSGSYSLPAGNPVTTGTTISSTVHNNTLSDIATALSDSLAKDGQTTPTANLPMGGYAHTGVGDATARTQYAKVSQIQDGGYVTLSSVSGTNTITATCAPAITAYAAGQSFKFTAAGANTGAVTLNINSLGAKAVTKEGATALAAGDIASGAVVWVDYDGTRFQLTSGRSVQPLDATLTALAGAALDMLRVKADESGYEHRTPAQVRADIGAEPAGATAAMPIGAVIMWPRATAPAKYLECAGQLVSRTAYPELFDVLGIYYSAGDGSTTFGLPDYRGVFLRGWDHGRGIADVNRDVGVYTPDAFAAHNHLVTNNADVWGGGAGGSQGYLSNNNNNTIHQSDAGEARRNRTTDTGGAETYPKHIITMFCIRALP